MSTTTSATYSNEAIGPLSFTNIGVTETDTAGSDTLSFVGSSPAFGVTTFSSDPTFDGIDWNSFSAGTFGDVTGDQQQQVLSFSYNVAAAPGGAIFGIDSLIIGTDITPAAGVTFTAIETVTDSAGATVATLTFNPEAVTAPTYLPTGYSDLNINLTITSTITNPGVDMSSDVILFSGIQQTFESGAVSIDKQVSVDGKTWYDVGSGVLNDPTTLVGDAVYYRVIVTNSSTQGVSLDNAVVNDANGPGPFTFGGSTTFSLASGDVITSDVTTATAVAGYHVDTATLTGTFSDGTQSIAASASDTADYSATAAQQTPATVTVDKQVSVNGTTWVDVGSGVLNDPSVMAGCKVYFRVLVTNTSSATITGASVADSNGENFGFGSGTATTIAAGATVTSNVMTVTAVAGHQIDTATLTGTETVSAQTVAVIGSDTADYTGVSPGLSVLKVPGTVVVGSGDQETYTFYVTNTGSEALTNVSIVDNIGTAANPDDVTPTAVTSGGYNVGDVNHNGILDPGEVWKYTETVTVGAGSSQGSGSNWGGSQGGGSNWGGSQEGGSNCGGSQGGSSNDGGSQGGGSNWGGSQAGSSNDSGSQGGGSNWGGSQGGGSNWGGSQGGTSNDGGSQGGGSNWGGSQAGSSNDSGSQGGGSNWGGSQGGGSNDGGSQGGGSNWGGSQEGGSNCGGSQGGGSNWGGSQGGSSNDGGSQGGGSNWGGSQQGGGSACGSSQGNEGNGCGTSGGQSSGGGDDNNANSCGSGGSTTGSVSATDVVTVTATAVSPTPPVVSGCQTLSNCGASSGKTLWLSSCFKPTSTANGATYDFKNINLSICSDGKTVTEQAPDCQVTFSSSCRQASTTFDSGSNCWVTTLPAGQNCGNVFLSGVPVQVPSGCNYSNASVTWSIGSSENNCGTSNLSWQTSASTYNNFCQTGSNNYNNIGVQSCDTSSSYGWGGYGNNGAGCASEQNSYGNCASQTTQTCGTVSSTCSTTTVTATDAKEIQVLASNSNITVNGTAPTGNLAALFGTAEKIEFTYNPGDTVSLAPGSSTLASVTGANAAASAFLEISNSSNPTAAGAQIYFEGNVTAGENIFADATTNPLTGAAVTGSADHFSTATGAELYGFVFASQQAFQSGAAPVQTLAYGTAGQMHSGDTVGSLVLAGYVGSTGGHLVG